MINGEESIFKDKNSHAYDHKLEKVVIIVQKELAALAYRTAFLEQRADRLEKKNAEQELPAPSLSGHFGPHQCPICKKKHAGVHFPNRKNKRVIFNG